MSSINRPSIVSNGPNCQIAKSRNGEQPASASVGGLSGTGQKTQQWRRTTGHHSLMQYVGSFVQRLIVHVLASVQWAHLEFAKVTLMCILYWALTNRYMSTDFMWTVIIPRTYLFCSLFEFVVRAFAEPYCTFLQLLQHRHLWFRDIDHRWQNDAAASSDS